MICLVCSAPQFAADLQLKQTSRDQETVLTGGPWNVADPDSLYPAAPPAPCVSVWPRWRLRQKIAWTHKLYIAASATLKDSIWTRVAEKVVASKEACGIKKNLEPRSKRQKLLLLKFHIIIIFYVRGVILSLDYKNCTGKLAKVPPETNRSRTIHGKKWETESWIWLSYKSEYIDTLLTFGAVRSMHGPGSLSDKDIFSLSRRHTL